MTAVTDQADTIDELIEKNADAHVSEIKAIPFDYEVQNPHSNNDYYYFFCGAVVDQRGHIIGIPNRYHHVLDIDPANDIVRQWGDVAVSEHKGWTGGCLTSDGHVVAFPRGAQCFLQMDTEAETVTPIEIGKKYDYEHHYGGAISYGGVIYLPPKAKHCVLSYNTGTGHIAEIMLPKGFIRNTLFYGASKDLDGVIYFFPAGRFVRAVAISEDGCPYYFGKVLHNAFFNSGTLAADGNIYGFSSYGNGIIKIETKKKKTKIIEKKFQGGCFGAKLGFNGKIYGIPGDIDCVVEYSLSERRISSRFALPPVQRGQKAKCAGGAVDRNGNIWCIPAMGKYIYKICFEEIKAVPSDRLYRSLYFQSTY